jgi:uncharacterized protein
MSKKTLVIGASSNPGRYSYKAVHMLVTRKHDTIPLGNKEGMIAGVKILHGFPEIQNVHTVTMYLNAHRQKDYINYILSLNPRRIIFNPGAENPDLEKLARHQNIDVIKACTLVLLANNHY